MTVVYKISPAMNVLLNFICKTEAAGNWNAYWGHAHSTSPVLADMTLAQLRHWMSNRGTPSSSATGGLQFMSYTLFDKGGAINAMRLPLDTKFTEATQRQLGAFLLNRRGFAAWESRKASDATFGNNLAFEWASFPRWTTYRQPNGRVSQPGQSAYAGDSLNKALISVAQVKEVFAEMRRANAAAPGAPGAPGALVASAAPAAPGALVASAAPAAPKAG